MQPNQHGTPSESMLELVPGSFEWHSIRIDFGIELTRITVTLIDRCCNDRWTEAVTDAPHRYFSFKAFQKVHLAVVAPSLKQRCLHDR